ncbi:MAG: ATP-dependent zinc metalloprotease FtsH [Planctomycetota bacterium]
MMTPPDRSRWLRFIGLALLVLSFTILLSLPRRGAAELNDLSYVRAAARAGDIEELFVIPGERRLRGRFTAASLDGEARTFDCIAPTDDLLTRVLDDVETWNREHADALIPVRVRAPANVYLMAALQTFPWLLLGFALVWLYLRNQRNLGAGPGAHPFARSRVRPAKERSQITFDDVAGIQEAKDEVYELIEFLRDPARFHRLGGRIPRGVLLVGPPGTGKTLLAKAVAGEAGVPFFSISGSDFVELFVGVGAARVRDLFRQAREQSPCIVFLDEIDAVGRRRGASSAGGSEEREQTLNAILVEMDGFESESGVIVIAASNRPDVLDPALLRPGRFDREITVELPDMAGRVEILKVHARRVPLGSEVDLQRVARGTPTFSGADLAALVNEAALIAALADRKEVAPADLEEARDKVRWGRAKKSRAMVEEDRRITAFHEAGHALLALLLPDVEPLHKVTIIPRGPTLGATMQLPERDHYHFSRTKAFGNLMVLFGGRIAEARFCGDVSSGASNDLERASELARRMVCEWGMSARVGPIAYKRSVAPMQLEESRGIEPLGAETRREIDREIRRLVEEAYAEAETVIEQHAEDVEIIARALLEDETLSGEEVAALIAPALKSEQAVAPC